MSVKTVVPALLLLGLPVALGVPWARASEVGRASPDDALLSALGCGGCHEGLPAPEAARDAAPALGPGAPPLSGDFVFEYLGDPGVRRPEVAPSRMPDFQLAEGERVALARFLGVGDPGPALSAAADRNPGADAAAGRALFGALGCAACHAHPDAPGPPGTAPSLAGAVDRLRPDWVRGWLADPGPVRPAHLGGGRMPDFRLTDTELDAVTTALTGADGRGGGAGRPAPGWLSEGVPEVRAARAERLLETRYACRGCHVVAGRGGAVGPPLDGVAERLHPDFVVRMIADPAAARPGSAMPRQPMPRREAEILAAYLLGLDGPWRGPVADAPGRVLPSLGGHAVGTVGAAADGAALYATWCAACHGGDGGGDGWNARALPVAPTAHSDAAALSPRPDDVLYDGIHGGGWVLGRSPLMPAFGAFLSPEQIDALVAHLRTLCRCEAPAWSRDGGGRVRGLGGVAALVLALAGCGDGGERAAGGRAAAGALVAFPPAPPTPAPAASPDDFVGAAVCADCHAEQHAAWSGSTHGRAGGAPSPDVVVAPFDGTPMVFADGVVIPERQGGEYRFVVRQDGHDELVYTVDGVVGGGHMIGGGTQGFVTRMADGTVRFLPFDWSVTGAVWFCNTGSRTNEGWDPVTDAMALADCGDWPPVRPLGVVDRFGNCQGCHGSRIVVDEVPGEGYATAWTTLAVDCESCHGPGVAHVASAEAGTLASNLGLAPLTGLGKDASLETCFACHALKDVVREGYLPGAPLAAYYALKFPMLGDEPYRADLRVRTFAYQGTHLGSQCYLDGPMDCVSCHEPHGQGYQDTNKRPLDSPFDDGQCLSCHASKARDVSAHTFHAPASEGSRCVSCHMPYLQHPEVGDGVPFARSDHTIPVPRPTLDLEAGGPSACGLCHADLSTAELQAAADEWWGELRPQREAIRGLRSGDAAAAALLHPGVVDPLAQFQGLARFLSALAPDAPLEAVARERLEELAADPDLEVRALALATLHWAAGDDPAVRRILVDALRGDGEGRLRDRQVLALGFLGDRYRDAGEWTRGLAGYQKALQLRPGDPALLSAAGQLYARAGDLPAAVAAHRRSVEADGDRPMAWVNLGVALGASGDAAGARAAYERAVALNPHESVAWNNLGNLALRAEDYAAAADAYGRAVAADPGLAQAHFNLGRALIFLERYAEALPHARRAVEFDPDHEGSRQMLRDLEGVVGGG